VRRDASGKVVDAFSLVQDITDRRQAEERLHAHHKRLRALASELSVVEARERRRLASYLHDHIGQNLAIAKIKLGELRQSASSRGMAASLDGIRNLLDETIQETRSLTFDLSPPILYELGFEPAVEWLTERMQKEHGLPCRFEDDGQAKPLEEDLRAVLFRSVRELLVNVVKHAHARSAKVSLRKEGGDMRIVVEDDGVGFESSGAELYPGQSGGFGLFSILERLTYFGGRVHIESEPGRGTRITLVAPLAPNERVRSGRAYPKGKE
jgi:signal transduction histidine kinase